MKNIRSKIRFTLFSIILAAIAGSFSSCGTTGVYGGIHHDFAYDWDGGYLESVPYYKRPYYKKHHKPAKKHPKKAKKAHKPHKKAHRHHDD